MKKEFERPELVFVSFSNEDIILTSAGYDPYGEQGEEGGD